MGQEYELKFRASSEVLDRIRRKFSGDWQAIPMKTTYYDAADGSLSRRKWTLRHRMEGTQHICTLKTPGKGGIRGEWETECSEIGCALMELSRLSGLTLPPARQLREVCGAEFLRLALRLEQPEFVCELALDQGVLRNGKKDLPFTEVEAELKSGSKEAFDRFSAAFSAEFDLETEPRSKFLRARLLGEEKYDGI